MAGIDYGSFAVIDHADHITIAKLYSKASLAYIMLKKLLEEVFCVCT